MRNQRTLPVLAVALLAAGLLAVPAGLGAQSSAPVKMEWLSWSHFRFTSPTGKVILTNPFTTNPDSPIKAADITKADFILVADGHGDEVGASDEIAIKTGAKIIAAGEMMRNYYEPRKLPPAQFLPAGPSDWYRLDGLTVRIVNAVHGSGTPDKTYGGPALGFMVQFENGLTVYFSGSTGLTMDMQLWGSLYKPDVAILSLASRRDPQDIVHMVRLLRTDNPNLKTVIPHHHRLQPPAGAPTVADMENVLKASGLPVRVLNPELSRAYELTK
jgi:L-ascorbate metabolism protein UlaG (beta-lactamase superfamily)